MNSCPAKVQCYKDVYDIDYEEPSGNFFDDDLWGDWFDETPMDETPVDQMPVHATPVYSTPAYSTPVHTTTAHETPVHPKSG